jgi:hypothetical protein
MGSVTGDRGTFVGPGDIGMQGVGEAVGLSLRTMGSPSAFPAGHQSQGPVCEGGMSEWEDEQPPAPSPEHCAGPTSDLTQGKACGFEIGWLPTTETAHGPHCR